MTSARGQAGSGSGRARGLASEPADATAGAGTGSALATAAAEAPGQAAASAAGAAAGRGGTASPGSAATPMIAQYLEIKARHPDSLLFYRMGDFYEMFFGDAEVASAALDIALTARGQHQGKDIPMCGVPVATAGSYLQTLIRKGFRVAICEQLEDPAEARRRGAKAVVHRDVVRLVTPGTLTEDQLLEGRSSNHLAAFARIREAQALAWCDVSTGLFRVAPVEAADLGAMLARIAPCELLVAERERAGIAPLLDADATLTPRPDQALGSEAGAARLCRQFGVASTEAFGHFTRAELAAMGAIIDYLELTQKARLATLRPPLREDPGAGMRIDAATRRNLELLRGASGGRQGSLLASIDRTVTAAGARLLAERITRPETDPDRIAARLDQIAACLEDPELTAAIRQALARTPDPERALSRLALGRGGPRDLAAIRDAGLAAAGVAAALAEAEHPALSGLAAALGRPIPVIAALEAALVADPPLQGREGGAIAPGHDPALDEQRRLATDGQALIADLQAEYRALTGIAALKLRENAVLGHFVETPVAHAARMAAPPLAETFRHRQTTASAVRYTTDRLADLEQRIRNAAEAGLAIETRILAGLTEAVLEAASALQALADALAAIDVATALATLARARDWVRPEITRDRAFAITAGRHPVVEDAVARAGGSFVPNDVDLGAGGAPLWLVTGPNMGGKSTFLRQNALIAVLAQAGSFVPARAARIGIVDRLFSRVGAADDLARGRSTFLVEMIETAAILNQASADSLVILDEIGRGTATHDGLSIAWAAMEHIHDAIGCRALFATHYHEMTALAQRLPGALNATLAVREWEGTLVFLHEVRRGAADRSYGLQVARLAGLPQPVLDRARQVLDLLEASDQGSAGRGARLVDDLPLFSRPAPAAPAPPPEAAALIEALASVDPDALSPRAALDLVYRLKRIAAGGAPD